MPWYSVKKFSVVIEFSHKVFINYWLNLVVVIIKTKADGMWSKSLLLKVVVPT